MCAKEGGYQVAVELEERVSDRVLLCYPCLRQDSPRFMINIRNNISKPALQWPFV